MTVYNKKCVFLYPRLLQFINMIPSHGELDTTSIIPKYQQVARLIVSDIESGIYKLGERIPSINETSEELLVARETVEKAYKELQKRGILTSIKGLGYFVANTDTSNQIKICLLMNKLSSYKKETYEGFVKVLEKKAVIDLHIYNYNIKLFEKIIENNLVHYDYFVIIPHFHPGSVGVEDIIRRIPKEKVMIIDKRINKLGDEYPTVYQDFEEDIISALEQGREQLQRYKRLILAYPEFRFFSIEIKNGFIRFCKTYNFDFKVIDRIEDEELEYLDAYVVISDEDLVTFVKKARDKGFTLGKAVGVISYNEHPLKEIIEGGITTISTNHITIGEAAANMLLTRTKGKIKIPFVFNKRNSL